ncbi:hypothetical protein ACJIZ3_013799 [Penstemon smallii]|uniref:Uncharacterized protein n=1 Tax=Penstemon smallii TaxID=265156 RepID=A0ABD3RPH8_9LAMI
MTEKIILHSPQSRLEGKVSLITGAASGLGESYARLFYKHGAKLILADIQDDLGLKLSHELGSQSSSFVHCDVTEENDVENAVNTAVSLYGKLDIMINNAGILGSLTTNIVQTEKSDFERILSTNLVGVFLGTKHAARVMIPNRSGVIISTGSVAGSLGGLGPYGYTCSKHALVGLTRNAAVELGEHGIRVNCVSPFIVTTPLLNTFFNVDDEGCEKILSDMNIDWMSPENVAQAVLFLASEDSKFVNGHNLMIDGGFMALQKI